MGTLFVLDDDTVFHRLVELTAVKTRPFKGVYHYYDAQSLLQYLYTHRNDHANLPDVIFVDLKMPGIDGWQFLDALQAFSAEVCKPVAVYIVTVSVIKDDMARAKTYRLVKDFIVKPISINWLTSVGQSVRQNLNID